MSIAEITFVQGPLGGEVPPGAGGETLAEIAFDPVGFDGEIDIPTGATYPIIGGSHIFSLGENIDG